MKALIDNAPYDAKAAREAGLIDGAVYRDEVDKGVEETARLQRHGRSAAGEGFRLPRS